MPGSASARRLREFGEQRIYASHTSIMFSRKSCYFFVRPKTKHLELVLFLGRAMRAPQIKRVERVEEKVRSHDPHPAPARARPN